MSVASGLDPGQPEV
uniref:Uncharacterized protein n=1 Tax=Arundo donax TaxID=35708 RepID=A0A0A9BS56_ARUDO